MATKEDLDKARDNFEKEKSCLEFSKDAEKIYKNIFKVGVGGLAYLGFRTFIGPELDLNNPEISNAWQFFDAVGMILSYVGGLAGGLSYLWSYAGRKSAEKDYRKAESELEKLSEDYQYSRGHI